MVRKVFVFYVFIKAYFKIIIALDGIIVLGQLTEKTVHGALVGVNLVVSGDFSFIMHSTDCLLL